ncbi:MAG: hypothetical protein RLY78_2207 [Pseudomonadota bacterium]|jgi:HD-like signal output (HDOD) protein
MHDARRPAPAAPPATTATRQKVAEELDQARRSGPLQHIRIPPCPEHLVRLREAMTGAEPDLTAIARIAGEDVAMSATLMRNANSPAWSTSGQPVQTVGQALTRLGLDETAAIMTQFLIRHAIPVDHPQLRRFWERSTLRAQAMRAIALRLPGLDPELAQLYGLFSHVGQPVLLQCVRGYGATLMEAAVRIDRSFIATENANHRTDHAVVGALVARTWHLAPALATAVRLHHDYTLLGSQETDAEVQTLVAAGLVAEHLMRQSEGLGPEADWSRHGEAALDWLGLDADLLPDWADELSRENA